MTWNPCPPAPRPPIAREHCRHYDYKPGFGPQSGPACAVGIENRGQGRALPCMPNPVVPCAAREEHTEAERDTFRAWMNDHTQRMVIVMTAIPREGFEGKLLCPACGGGTVRWTRASGNRHLHAACSTPHCFRIMQ